MMIKHWLQLIRFPNLIIIGLTQFSVQYGVLSKTFSVHQLGQQIDTLFFLKIMMLSIGTAAGGYIINDIVDIAIDAINKPEKQIVSKKITLARAQKTYLITLIISVLIALSMPIACWISLLIWLIPTILLWFYSKKWKQKVLIGNLVIAFLCAYTPMILFIMEKKGIDYLEKNHFPSFERLMIILATYVSMAFLTTLFREMIKDIEDMEGDKMGHCATLPIVYGLETARKMALGVGAFLMMILVLALVWKPNLFAIQFYILLIIFGMMLNTLIVLSRATTKSEFASLSKRAKWMMLTGLCYLFGFI
ncbi:MAG: hypothetical protein RL329_581 [Bacteroidota bacterium]